MHWRFRKINYDILIPPLSKSVYQLNEQEAADYYEWYMGKIPERVAYVSKMCAKELRISESELDLSPESLVLLWKWFRRRAKTERVVRDANDIPKTAPAELFKNKRHLTLETEYILRDIGMYFGETFRKNIPQIYWTYHTKPERDFFVNQPLLMGFVDMTTGKPFYACFQPIHMAHVQAVRILSNRSTDYDLLRIYNIWAEKI